MTVRIASLLLLVLVSSSLQGCFPVVAAGVGAGAMMAPDPRGRDIFFEDQQIEATAVEQIDKQFHSPMHVNVTSYNHSVLISGEVPDEATKGEVGKIVSNIGNVRNVNNDLAVSTISSLASRSHDALITSNVRLRFANDIRFDADDIKVVTENGTVYLMGLVKHAAADAASELTSTTKGVQRVMRMFEYVD